MTRAFLKYVPWLLLAIWGVFAIFLFSWSIEGDQELYQEVLQDPEFLRSRRNALPPPLSDYDMVPKTAAGTRAADRPKAPAPLPPNAFDEQTQTLTSKVEPPPPPVPAVWELRSLDLMQNDHDFQANFSYDGGALTPVITYQSRSPVVWIIDLPATWNNQIRNDYHWEQGLIRRLAIGLHQGYLRLVLYLRPPHGGRVVEPVVVGNGRDSFTISLKGALEE